MRYYVYTPGHPRQLRTFESAQALDDALAIDYSRGHDFADSDVVIDAQGRKGRVTFDGTAYELEMSDQAATPQELRAILTAHLAAMGRKPDQTAGPIAGVEDVAQFGAVLASFPSRRRLLNWVIAGLILIGVVAVLTVSTMIVVRVLRGPALPAPPPGATAAGRSGGSGRGRR